MKSLCNEICLTAEDGRIWFHLKPKAEDFIRALLGFHRAKHDFINSRESSNLNEKRRKYLFCPLYTNSYYFCGRDFLSFFIFYKFSKILSPENLAFCKIYVTLKLRLKNKIYGGLIKFIWKFCLQKRRNSR